MPPANPLESRVRARLAALQADGLLRTLRPPSGVDLSSNDYLCLSRHPLIGRRVIEAVGRNGCGSTGSRLLRGDCDAFHALEKRFAAFKRAERALYFGAGYLANLALLSTLPERGDAIFSDAFNHASLIDGMRLSKARTLVFPHNDVPALAAMLTETEASVRFVVVESLFSMEGDMAPLAEYAALCRSTGAVLIVDEAHAVGIYGARGTGLIEAASVDHASCISINTGGKALGVAGACVAGPSWAVEYLLQRARPFVFTTAPPPAFAEALEASLDVVAREPERRRRVLELAGHLRTRLAEHRIRVVPGSSQIVPVLIGDNDCAVAVAAAMQREGFDVRAIRPPSVPPGTARLRVSINVDLSERLLDRFADLLATVLKETPLCATASS
jgi:8-amino-7-oxononanoate synthase